MPFPSPEGSAWRYRWHRRNMQPCQRRSRMMVSDRGSPRIAEDEVGRQRVFLAQGIEFLPGQLARLFGKRGALEEHALHLGVQGADAPALDAAQLGIEVALQVVGEGNDLDEVAPAQL